MGLRPNTSWIVSYFVNRLYFRQLKRPAENVAFSPTLRSTLGRRLRNRAKETWSHEWETHHHGRSLHRVQSRISKKSLVKYKSLTKAHASILFQMRTGKIGLNHFRYTVEKIDSTECPCGTPHQTPAHLLRDYPDWTDLRHETLWQGRRQTRDISELLNDPSWAKRVANFMARTGILGAGVTTSLNETFRGIQDWLNQSKLIAR